jgi:hypothetical protein
MKKLLLVLALMVAIGGLGWKWDHKPVDKTAGWTWDESAYVYVD